MKDQNVTKEAMKFFNMSSANHIFKATYSPIFKGLSFISSTSILLALNGVMVVVFGAFMYNVRLVPSLLLASFLVTFGVYGLNKVTDKAEDSINKPEIYSNSSRYYLVLSVASMLTGFFIGILEGFLVFIILVLPVMIGVIYSVKISKAIPRLKEIVGVKSLVVGLSWALTGCLLPVSVFTEKLQAVSIVFGYIFIKVFVGTILCDVLDKIGDSAAGIETIPIRLGKNKTKNLLITINSFGLLLSIYCAATGMFLHFLPALIFGVLYGYMTIWFFFKDNCRKFTAGLMLDGEWFPIVAIASLLII